MAKSNSLFSRIWSFLNGDQGLSSPPLWDAYRIYLRVLAERKQAECNGSGKHFDPKILQNIEVAGLARTWESLYEAEQRLVVYLNDEEVEAEFARRAEEARHLGVKSVDALEAQFAKQRGKEFNRTLFVALFDDVHFRYIKRSFDRKTRRDAGLLLNGIGVFMLLVTLAGAISLAFEDGRNFLQFHHAAVVMFMGALGAFLSRMISFQGSMLAIDYDDLRNGYSGWTILVRLIVGSFCAVIFYFFVAGNLVSGELFPGGSNGTRSTPTAITFPDVNFAKLMIWSTLAGFSERLVPERLTKLESVIDEAKATKTVAGQ
jgi:hypothetical protein